MSSLLACASESAREQEHAVPVLTGVVSANAAQPATLEAAAVATAIPLSDHAQAPGFLGAPEDTWLDRLLNAKVIRVSKGRGGRSLAFKLELEGGTRGYYKPEQTFTGTNWYAEAVAYQLDRALGIGHVPPVITRRLPWSVLAPAAGKDKRVSEVIRAGDGTVRGALVGWLDGPLEPARTPPGWESWLRIEPWPPARPTPFQRASEHGAAQNAVARALRDNRPVKPYYAQVPKLPRAELAAELSDMLVIDFLTNNIDRWGGDNGNVLTLKKNGPLVFLDNAAGFSLGPHRRELMDGRFYPCEKFRKKTIDALEAFDVDAFGAMLARDRLAPLLTPYLLEGIEVRRKAVLTHVDRLRDKYGDDAVLAW